MKTFSHLAGGRQSGAVLYNAFGTMGKASTTEGGGVLTSNHSSDSPTGSGYNTDISDDNLPCDRASPSSDLNGNSVSDEQVGECLIMILRKNNIESSVPTQTQFLECVCLSSYGLDRASVVVKAFW